jgi:predicted ATPase
MEHLEVLDRSLPELLNALRSTVFVLTSRARMNLSLEAVLVLDPLGVPESGDLESVEASPSVALFRARTKDRAPALGDLALVGKLCQRLEGISLAIEIAAARAEIYSVREMIEQLEQPLEFLVTRDKDRPERHRSLRNAISWSYEQLTPATQRIFCLMAMAKAGWTLELASGVLGEGVVEAMEELLHASLLRRTVKGEFNWFSMHQTVRGFGRELLEPEEQEAARAAMLAWFLKRFEIDNPSALGPKLKEWLDAAEVQIENVRDLLEWGFTRGHAVEAAQLCVYLSAFWYRRGHRYEAFQWMTRAMDFSLPEGLRADLLRFGGIFAKSQGEFVLARGWLEEAERIYSAQQNHVQRAAVLNVLGGTLERLREMGDAELRFNQAFEESRRVKDPRMGLPLMNLAIMAARAAQHRKAIEIYGRALEVGVEYNEPFLSGYVLANLAFAYVRSGAFEDAERVIEEALKTNDELGNRTIHGFALQGSGMLAYYRGDFAGAISELDKSKAAFLEGGELEGQAQSDILKARIALVEGRVKEAKSLLGSTRITASHLLEKRMEGEACLLLALAGSDASWLRGAMDLLLFEPGSVEFNQLLLVMAEMVAEDAGALRAAAYDFYEASGTAADPLMRSLLEKPRGVGPDDPVAFAEAVLNSGRL